MEMGGDYGDEVLRLEIGGWVGRFLYIISVSDACKQG